MWHVCKLNRKILFNPLYFICNQLPAVSRDALNTKYGIRLSFFLSGHFLRGRYYRKILIGGAVDSNSGFNSNGKKINVKFRVARYFRKARYGIEKRLFRSAHFNLIGATGQCKQTP